ncbi:MAG: hypothetical protein HY026_00555 [Deltaproteobacteria bacterium]|nr:hypothetical protein [Deltaproteobacteria bacterium]
MKKLLFIAAAAVMVFAFSGTSFAATSIQGWSAVSGTTDYQGTQESTAAAGKAANGIVWTRHNLSSYGEHYQATTSSDANAPLNVATTEICVFCHTPHFGRTDTAPLWNRANISGYASNSRYTAYGTTVAGTGITSVGGSALACLSCHDGVTTLDALINAPGKGAYGAKNPDQASSQGWYFADNEDRFGTMENGGPHRVVIGDSKGLANDHPISVMYGVSAGVPASTAAAPLVASLRGTGTVIHSLTMYNARAMGALDASLSSISGDAGTYGRSDNLWAVKGYISDTATIGDLLRDGGQVQCASCHDPHYKNQTNTDPDILASYGVATANDGDIDGLFLRRVGGNSNSGVCRTCHNK